MSIKNPILLDLPIPINTERLTIRPLIPREGLHVFEAVDESRNYLKQWLPWVENVKTWEDSEKKVREFYADFIRRIDINFGVLHENRFVGMCSLHHINWAIPSAAIGYWCRVSEQRKGYMREAIAALTMYAFQQVGLRRITIVCDDANIKSAAIPEALGFTLETKAKGLIIKPGVDELSLGRRYVRFDSQGLEGWQVKW